MNIKDCFEKRLLRKIQPDIDKAKRSIEIAENKLETARKAFEKDMFEVCIIQLYLNVSLCQSSTLQGWSAGEKPYLCGNIFKRKIFP